MEDFQSKYSGEQVEALLDIVSQGGGGGGEGGGGTITEAEITAMGFTKNLGTITEVKMNGVSKGTSGVVDLGTVLTEHQDISGKADKSSLATVATTGSYNDLIDKPAPIQYFGPILDGVPEEDIVWDRSTGKATIDMYEIGFTHIVYPKIYGEVQEVFYNVVSIDELRKNPTLLLGAENRNPHGSVLFSESDGIATLTLNGTPKIYNYPWKAVVHNNGVVPLSEAFLPESAAKKNDLVEYVKHTELGDFEADVVDVKLAQKQDKLKSGENIKTINGESILGSGDIEIDGSYNRVYTDAVEVELQANTYTVVNTPVSDSLVITLLEVNNATLAAEYVIQFQVDALSNGAELIVPDGVVWADGVLPAMTNGKTYEISFVDNLATFLEF